MTIQMYIIKTTNDKTIPEIYIQHIFITTLSSKNYYSAYQYVVCRRKQDAE